jgi:hypothetical protein
MLQVPLVCHIRTFAASRHSITLTLKCEVAALFISMQLLAITKTAPLGSFTLVALRGLNSINLAYWKKSNRGNNNLLGFRKTFKLLCTHFILRKPSLKTLYLLKHCLLIARHYTRRRRHSSEQDRFCLCHSC